jgi:arabinofuranosyltransferase
MMNVSYNGHAARASDDRVHAFVARAAVALSAVVLAATMARAWAFTVDDAYITARYSRNLAAGLGATFNVTGPRAEGYTTFAWMLLLAVPHVLRVDAIVVAKALGVAATFATLLVASRWARDEALAGTGETHGAGGGWACAGAAVCLAAIPATAVHAVSGMETALFALLLTSMFAAAAARVRGDARATHRLVVLALLAGLTRPEGNFAAAIVIGTCVALVPPAERRSIVARAALGWMLPVGVYQLARYGYYGLPFPLPFYVKLGAPGRLPGWPDVRDWLLQGPPIHFALLMVPAALRPPRSLWPALAAAAALTAFFILPQHQMGYEHRYLAPLDPLCAVVAGVGLARIATSTFAREHAVRASAAALLALACGSEWMAARGALAGAVEYGEGLAHGHAQLGKDLRALGLPNGRLAIADAGAVPYLSGWWTLDLVGLNDARIATTGQRDFAAILAEKPDVVVLASEQADNFQPWDWNPWEGDFLAACTGAGYVRAALRRFGPTYWLWVMARPGSAAERGLASDVGGLRSGPSGASLEP